MNKIKRLAAFKEEQDKILLSGFKITKPAVSLATGSYRESHKSLDQAREHGLLESDPVGLKILVASRRGQIQHLTKAQSHTRKGLREHEAIPAFEIPGPVGCCIDWNNDSLGSSGQTDHPRLDDPRGPPWPIHNMSGETRVFQMTDHLSEGPAPIS